MQEVFPSTMASKINSTASLHGEEPKERGEIVK